MENYVNKIAVVTGASSGIGAGLAKELAKRGCIVIGLARRMEKLQALSDEIRKSSESFKGQFHFLRCDLTNRQELEETFEKIVTDYGIPWILVNNAGMGKAKHVFEHDEAFFDQVVDTNFKALYFATKLTVKLMSEHSIPGHILNVNSIQGHYMPTDSHNIIYCITKHMSRVFAEGIREMMAEYKWNIKISNVSPASVRTEITENLPHWKNSPEKLERLLTVDDVVKSCIFIIDTPPNVLIPELKIMPIDRSTLKSFRKKEASS